MFERLDVEGDRLPARVGGAALGILTVTWVPACRYDRSRSDVLEAQRQQSPWNVPAATVPLEREQSPTAKGHTV